MERLRSTPNSEDPRALPVFRIVSVSTAHIARNDDTLLAEDARTDQPWMLGNSPHGWVMLVPDSELLESTLQQLAGRGYSEQLRALVLQAHMQQARFLRFDGDEYVVEGWPTFEW